MSNRKRTNKKSTAKKSTVKRRPRRSYEPRVSDFIQDSPAMLNVYQHQFYMKPLLEKEHQKGYNTALREVNLIKPEYEKEWYNKGYQSGKEFVESNDLEGLKKDYDKLINDALPEVYSKGLLKGWNQGDKKYLIVKNTNDIEDQFFFTNSKEDLIQSEKLQPFTADMFGQIHGSINDYMENKRGVVSKIKDARDKALKNQVNGNTVFETPNYKLYQRGESKRINLFPENRIPGVERIQNSIIKTNEFYTPSKVKARSPFAQ